MKKAITFSICLLVTITSLAASYADNASAAIVEGVNKDITLTLNNVKEGQNLLIKDVYGFILYKKELENAGSTKHTFDFSTLPNGTYYFEHEKAYQIKIMPFKVKFGEVTFDTGNEKVIYKPVIRVKENNIYLSKLNLEKEDVSVALYYQEEANDDFKVIHSEDFSDAMDLQRIYSLSEKQAGNYKMIVKANDRDYVEYFSL